LTRFAEDLSADLKGPEEEQFGVNVISQAALSRYDHSLTYRKIADRFEQLHGLGTTLPKDHLSGSLAVYYLSVHPALLCGNRSVTPFVHSATPTALAGFSWSDW